MDNNDFLEIIKESFYTYLSVGTSRSTAKLKSLHGYIAKDIEDALGAGYTVKSQGYGDGKEGTIKGKYYDKKVDITVFKDGEAVAGYAVKFVMRNYSQNSNNYFENMLGETANIRANSIPYFQIFIIFNKVPYFDKYGDFRHYDIISAHNLSKYILLSENDPDVSLHTPDKTLFVTLKLKDKATNYIFANSTEYADYYKSIIGDADMLKYSPIIQNVFGDSIIYNDYENFVSQTKQIILDKTE